MGLHEPDARHGRGDGAARLSAPAVEIRSIADARAAAAAAEALGLPVMLVSIPAAAASLGPLAFQAMVDLVRAERPGARICAAIDCADQEGRVLHAFRAGCAAAIFHGRPDVAAKLAEIAAGHGATLLTERPATLSLAGARDPDGACRAWIRSRSAAPAAAPQDASTHAGSEEEPR
ncbi:MAG: hypothetical protein AB7O45_17190 [Alphaproteobacteria bacterium]